ncbi:MAG: trypsin-like peptidase domain-containing protein [Patescibacteria group bacterium]|nr:trypsin-like peptidase domain-containing protein [Patescibacteria group bacterium]
MNNQTAKGFLIGLSFSVITIVSLFVGAIADRVFVFKPLDAFVPRNGQYISDRFPGLANQRVLSEESVVIEVAEKASPSVVTISVQVPRRRILNFSPFGGFSQRFEGGDPQDIGTGFIVSEDGLVVTNKHVVSNANAKYKVITKDNKEYEVEQISRDPTNDLAIIKLKNASNLTPLELGSSENLKVGQMVIAIGTALGEFRHTVTTGVISGLGRGIVAGSVFEGYIERLDDVIQTDAAINPGNSGGPLLNSAGQVIGVNVAVAQGAENIGFAIPVDILKKALSLYRETGSFASKPFLGVRYEMISKEVALLNKVPQGAYVVDITEGSAAEKSGIKPGDIITKIDDEEINEKNPLADVISKKKPGQTINIEIWRDGDTVKISATLSQSN